jgi:hypothetical protein
MLTPFRPCRGRVRRVSRWVVCKGGTPVFALRSSPRRVPAKRIASAAMPASNRSKLSVVACRQFRVSKGSPRLHRSETSGPKQEGFRSWRKRRKYAPFYSPVAGFFKSPKAFVGKGLSERTFYRVHSWMAAAASFGAPFSLGVDHQNDGSMGIVLIEPKFPGHSIWRSLLQASL